MGHASKERVLLIGTDQRITSGPAATTAAFRGRIHGCTRIVSRKVRFFSLAPRAPSIHDPSRHSQVLKFRSAAVPGPARCAILSIPGIEGAGSAAVLSTDDLPLA